MLRIAVFSQNDFKYTPAWKSALCYVTKGTATVLIPLPVIVLHAEASICHLPKNWNWQHGISLRRRRRRIQSRIVWLLQPLIGGSWWLHVRPISKSPRNEVRVPGILHTNRCLMHLATKPSTEADCTAPPHSIETGFFVLVITNLVPFTLLFIARRCLSHSVGNLGTPSVLTDSEMPVCEHDPSLIQSDDILPVLKGRRRIWSVRLSAGCERPRSTRKIRIWSYVLVLLHVLGAPCAEMEQKPQRLTTSNVLVVKASTVQS